MSSLHSSVCFMTIYKISPPKKNLCHNLRTRFMDYFQRPSPPQVSINYNKYTPTLFVRENGSLNTERNRAGAWLSCSTGCRDTLSSTRSTSIVRHAFALKYFRFSGLILGSILWHVNRKLPSFMKIQALLMPAPCEAFHTERWHYWFGVERACDLRDDEFSQWTTSSPGSPWD